MASRKYLKTFDGRVLIQAEERRSVYTLIDDLKGKTSNFSGIDLSNTSLPGIALSYLTLNRSKLYHGEYQLGTFSKSLINDVDWSESDFDRCFMIQSVALHSRFSGCNFSGADLSYSNFSGSNFSGSSFRNAILKNIIVDEDTDFTECDFTGATMTGNLMEAIFDLAKVDFKSKTSILKLM